MIMPTIVKEAQRTDTAESSQPSALIYSRACQIRRKNRKLSDSDKETNSDQLRAIAIQYPLQSLKQSCN